MRLEWHDAHPVLSWQPFKTQPHFPGQVTLSSSLNADSIPFPQMAQGKGLWEGEGQGGWHALEGFRSASLPWDLGSPPPR